MYVTNDCERFADAKAVSVESRDIYDDEYETITVMNCGCVVADNYETTPGFRCHMTFYNCDSCKMHMKPKLTEHPTEFAPSVREKKSSIVYPTCKCKTCPDFGREMEITNKIYVDDDNILTMTCECIECGYTEDVKME